MIALVTMVIGHVGTFIYPDNFWLFGVGRLAFPLFAWLISNGTRYTKNLNAYMTRLFVFGLISQMPFLLAIKLVEPSFSGLNIMFTLFAGLLCIKIWKSDYANPLKCLFVLLVLIVSYLTKVDYGPLGVLSILFFYLFSESPKKMLLSQAIIFMLFFSIQVSLRNGFFSFSSLFPSLALLSLIFINRYNFESGPRAKYLFYFFYPSHLFIFYLVLKILG